MIISCEKCATRFKLDDSRIPADGVRVRCSRCKHAFLVRAEDALGASDPQVADALARQAQGTNDPADRTQAMGTDDPADRTQAMGTDDPAHRTRAMGSTAEARDASFDAAGVDFSAPARTSGELDEDGESDWEFNEDPEAGAPEAAADPEPDAAIADLASPELGVPGESAPEPAGREGPAEPGIDRGAKSSLDLDASVPSEREGPAQADPMRDFMAAEPQLEDDGSDAGLEELGDPDEWNLLPDDAAGPEDVVGVEAATAGSAAPAAVAGEGEVEAQASPAADAGLAPVEIQPPRAARSLAQSAGLTLAWLAVAALAGVAAWGSLIPRPQLAGGVASAPAGAFEAANLRARVVENAVVGPLLVVSGELRNPEDAPQSSGALLRVRPLDARGAFLGERGALVGFPPSERDLRTVAPEELLRAQSRGAEELARTPVLPGEAIPVVAFFAAPPDGIRGFRFELGEPIGVDPPAPQAISSGASPTSPRPSRE